MTSATHPLKISVIGAGNVGCLLGGHLAQCASVTLVGRPRVLEPISKLGLTVELPGRKSIKVPAGGLGLSESMESVRDADVVLVTTKARDAASVTREFHPFLRPESLVVGLQNGLHTVNTIRDGVDVAPVIAGMVPFNIAQTGPATYRRTSSGAIFLEEHPRVRRLVAAASRAKLDIRTTSDMSPVLHGKVMLNLNNAIQALSGIPLREELLDPDFRLCLSMAQREALRAFTAAGTVPQVPMLFPSRVLPLVLRLPTPVFRLVARAQLNIDAAGTSSMTDDLKRGLPTEIDAFQGEVAAIGSRLGVDTPVCSRLVELVRQAEVEGAGRRRWAGHELLAELRSARRRAG